MLLRTCHVKYTLKSTIQTTNLERINAEYINRYQKMHKNKFFSRIAEAKKEVAHIKTGQIKLKTSVNFMDEIGISL